MKKERGLILRRRVFLQAGLTCLMLAGACYVEPAVDTSVAEIKNGTIWDPWAQSTQTWTRNVVRLGGCTGTLLDSEWVLSAGHCFGTDQAPSTITVRHTLADGSVEQTVGAELLFHPQSAHNTGDSTTDVDVALVRLAEPLHPGVASLPIVGGTTADLVGQTVFCAGYGATDTGGSCTTSADCDTDEFCQWGVCMTRNDGQLRTASFQIIADPVDPSIWYRFQVPNILGQLELPGDSGSSCWNGQGLTGVMKAGNPTNYNRQTSGPAARAWIESIVFKDLALQNGWTHAPYATRNAGVSLTLDGIVRFRGAIADGTSSVAFTLPSGYRPVTNVYVPVDLCNARKGRLLIQPSGAVSIQAEQAFSDAQCFTSLEGASFVLTALSYVPALQNDWVNAPFSTRTAALSPSAGGIMRFRGAIAGGTSALAFTLPSVYRPATNVYVPVDLCGAKKGRLLIQPSGAVSVQAEQAFSDAQCFTSLEGASYALSTASFTALSLQNGWANAPFGTRNAAVTNDVGIIRFAGAIASGTSAVLFTLPSELRPATNVYVPVDLCGARKGRLLVQPSGTVSVQAKDAFSDAQCFTSLEGAWYAL